MDNLYNFLMELDKLKSVYRRAYLSDLSRNENSAEHSWHLAMTLLTLKDELAIDIDITRALKMALVHDIGEIGAGDISVYDPRHSEKTVGEREYLQRLSSHPIRFSEEIKSLWEEYEAQQTKESHWVKVADRLLPFVMNLATEGKTWIEQEVAASQVKEVHKVIDRQAPEIYQWMLAQIDKAVARGWLIDA